MGSLNWSQTFIYSSLFSPFPLHPLTTLGIFQFYGDYNGNNVGLIAIQLPGISSTGAVNNTIFPSNFGIPAGAIPLLMPDMFSGLNLTNNQTYFPS